MSAMCGNELVPSRRERLAWYAAATALSCGIIFWGMRLDHVNLGEPFSYGGGTNSYDSIYGSSALMPDVLLILPLVKATLERGSHWRNERMGAPGVSELYDFPVIDHVHFALIWLLGQVDWIAAIAFLLVPFALLFRRVPPDRALGIGTGLALVLYLGIHLIRGSAGARYLNYVEVYNLYYLLTYPLTTLTAMYAFRRLGLSLPMAGLGGILYAFLPYHYLRGEAHYFLAAYWMVPLSWLPALDLCRGRLPFFRLEPGGTYCLSLRSGPGARQILLAAATASAGAYYAFFACAIYAFAGLYSWIALRTWRAAASSVLLVGFVAFFGLLNHLPSFLHAREFGRNAITNRLADEAEIYGLKFAHLVLPVDGHNLIELGRIKSRYNSSQRPLQTENTCATLGFVGAAGFLFLLVCVFSPSRRGWPYGPLAAFNLVLFLYGTIGGFSSVFNLLVFDQIRCPNRVSIYMAFICLFAALYPLDRFLLSRTGRARKFRIPAIVGLGILGIADQTPTAWFSPQIVEIAETNAKRFRDDRDFFALIEERMEPGARIFCMPYMRFPEEPPLHDMNTYEHARGYLHTNTLVWSYGAIKNRETDAWQMHVYHGRRDQILRKLVVRGFDGIFIDKRGYLRGNTDEGGAMLQELRIGAETESSGRVKIPFFMHPDGQQAFLDIRPYRDWLRAQEPVRYADWEREEREWASMTWIQGSISSESYGREDLNRWMFPRSTAMIVNPSDRTRTFRFSAVFGSDVDGPFEIRIRGGTITRLAPDGPAPWEEEFTFERKEGDWDPAKRRFGVAKEYLLEVPPGRHFVKFSCGLPSMFMPADARPLSYFLRDIKFHEVKR